MEGAEAFLSLIFARWGLVRGANICLPFRKPRKRQKSHGIVMKGIVTCIRRLGPVKPKTLRCVQQKHQEIPFAGMGGAETFGVQADYSTALIWREAGLRLTTHAGEWGGAESMRQAIFDLKAERVGHGVQVIEDSHLIDEVIAYDITLEVCPGSNVALGINFTQIPTHKKLGTGCKRHCLN